MKYYIVGIDGRETPDPRYWFDRWHCIEAGSEKEALNKHFDKLKNWLRDDEKQYVKVWAVLDEKVWVGDWIRENMMEDYR